MLPETDLFDELQRRFAQFRKLRERDQRGAKALSIDERGIGFYIGMQRIFFVEIREQLLTGLSHQEVHEQFGAVEVFG